MTGRRWWIGAVALLAVAIGEPLRAEDACPDGTERFAEYRMFFGRSKGGNEVVSDADWRQFLAREITPRFPDGLSVLDVAGQWRNAAGTIERERSKLLIVIAPPGALSVRDTAEIAAAYRLRFGQESVPRVISPVCAAF